MIGFTWYQPPQSSVMSQSREEWLLQQNSKLSGHTAFSLNLSGGLSNTHTSSSSRLGTWKGAPNTNHHNADSAVIEDEYNKTCL